jgi:hypothetical protein
MRPCLPGTTLLPIHASPTAWTAGSAAPCSSSRTRAKCRAKTRFHRLQTEILFDLNEDLVLPVETATDELFEVFSFTIERTSDPKALEESPTIDVSHEEVEEESPTD